MNKYNFVVCGGSFDHFHKGHEKFLDFVLKVGTQIVLGLTTNKYLEETQKDQKESLEDYETRKKSLEIFLNKSGAARRVKIVPIDDISGPLVYDPKARIEAIIVSKQTKKGAEIINKERIKRNLKELDIIEASLVCAEDRVIISSSRIRAGEINRSGKAYKNPIWLSKTWAITESLRKKLSKPFGLLIKRKEIDFLKIDSHKIVTVGDVVTSVFNEKRNKQKISVIDFLVQRKRKFTNLKELGFEDNEFLIKIKNPAGLLTPSLFKAAFDVFKIKESRIIIVINGEEDLSVLPLILGAPLGYVIFYGQPRDKGIVRVDISEERKEQAYNLIGQFK